MKNKIRILHIDDDLHNSQIIKDTLQKEQDEFEIIETDNPIELDLHLNKSDFDLVLSDINILGFEGLTLLKKLNEIKSETPVIIVTGNGSEEIAVEAMKLGAADYVIKSEKHIQNLASIIRNVIENKKTQEEQDTTLSELRKSEERFRLLFDSSMDAVLLTEPNGGIHKINAAACIIFGRTEEEIKQIGRNCIFDITDPQLAIAIEEYSLTGKYKGELTGLRKDGTPFPIEISSTLFHNSDGNPRTSMIIRDISERREAEKTQLTLSLRNEAILASVPEIIMEVNSNKIYTWANQAGIEFFGEDVIGKDAAWYFEEEQETYNLLEPLFNGTKSIIYIESLQRRCDGEKRLLAWWCRLLEDKDGKVTGAMSAAQDITDRKRIDEALIASEIRYRRLFESANDGILILNAETGVIVDVNPYLVKLLGYSTEQFHEKKIWEIGVFSDIIANQAKFLELQQKEYVRYDDMPLKTSDGRQITVEFISNVYESNHHKVIQCNIRDNTDRTNKQNEIKFQSDLINNVGQSVIATDLLGNVTYWNNAAEKIYGWSTTEAIGQNIINLTPAEQSSEQAVDIMQKLSEGKTWAGEFYVKRKDGSSFPAFVSDAPILDSNGNLTGFIGISSDISERKLSEELLVASEIRYRRLFESAKDGILILDAETGMIVDVNPFLKELLGFSTEQFQGKKIWEIGVFSDIIANQAKFLELQLNEYILYEDLPLKTVDGRHIDVEFVSNVYEENHQKVIQCNIRDITERKLIEKEIRDIARFPSENPSPILRIANNGTLLFVNEVGMKQLQEWKLQTGQPAVKMLQDVVFKTLDKGEAQEVEFEHKEKVFSFYVVPYAEEGYANMYGLDITERKKAEELRMIQTTALEATAVSVVITDAEGTITWVNNAFTRMTGYSKEEAIGNNPRILKSGKHDESFYKNMWDTVKAGNVWRGEVINKRKDNSLLNDEMTITPVRGKNGVVQHFITLKQDITERKRISVALHESEQLLSKSQKFAHIGSYKYIINSNELIWSDEMYNIFGVQKDTFKLTPESFLNCIHPEDRSSMINSGEQTIKGNDEEIDFRIVKPDGTIRNLLGAGSLEGEKDNKPLYIIGSTQDITERKNIEKALKESEMKFRFLLENSADAIFITDSKGKYIYTNKAVTDLLGYSSEEMLSKTIVDLAPEAQIENYIEIINEILSKGKAFTEIELLNKDGNYVSVDLNSVLLPDGSVYGSCRDITERKQAEAEILNLNSSLELMVEVRTKKLSEVNTNLVEAKIQAEQANKAKSVFLSNMSHEIRTPMNAVLGYAELLNNILQDKTQKDYLKSITSSGKTLLTLINDILDLSKIEEGKLELTFDYVNTHSFFSEFERIFSWKVEEKGLTFILDIVSGMPAGIYVDETRLRQIILNLIGNAVKFTQNGHIKLKVYIENPQFVKLSNKISEEYIDLVIEVEDTGIGISSEFQDQIFEPFAQEQHKNQLGGTGLGLAISRRLLILMNGTISLQSELNKGTTFQLKIPDIAYLRDFERKTDGLQIDPATIVFEKATILIVDDVAHNRKYFVDALKNTNIEIVEAEDGLTGYSLAKDIVPDVIITDLRMPKLDGFGLLKKIQGNAKLSHIHVIAYSASVMKEQKEKVFNCKFSGLLIKPVSVTDLYIELMNYLPYTRTLILEKDHPTRKGLFEKINNLQGLIHSLETVYTDVWKKFEVRQPMDEVKEFGENIENLGETYNAEIIKKYGRNLIIAAENFNIESILKLLNKYPGIIKEIKEYQSNN